MKKGMRQYKLVVADDHLHLEEQVNEVIDSGLMSGVMYYDWLPSGAPIFVNGHFYQALYRKG
jgi:hypothetical protein